MTPVGSSSSLAFPSDDSLAASTSQSAASSNVQELQGRSIQQLAPDIDFDEVKDMWAMLGEDRAFFISCSPKYEGESPQETVSAADLSHCSVETQASFQMAFQRGQLKDIFCALYYGCVGILEMSFTALLESYLELIGENGKLTKIIQALQALIQDGCSAFRAEAEQLLSTPLLGGSLLEWGTESSPLLNASLSTQEQQIFSESLIMILLECLKFSITLLEELTNLDERGRDILGTGNYEGFKRTYFFQF